MKKVISLLLALVLCLFLCACGKSEAVKNVEAMIDGIGEITVNSGDAITAAQTAYDALSEDEKSKVGNFANLSSARTSYVIALIDAIGKITPDSKDEIIKAESAYNALSDEEKAKITNSDVLYTAWADYYYACLLGDWQTISTGEQIFTLSANDSLAVQGYTSTWKYFGNYILVNLGAEVQFDISDIDDVIVLEHPELGTLVKNEDYKKIFDKYFVDVELTTENISDYIEFLPYKIEYVDAFGDGTGRYDCGVATSSKVFDDGLVYWSSGDVAIEIIIPNNYMESLGDTYHWSIYSAGSHSWGWENGKTVVDQVFAAVIYGFSNYEFETMLDFHPEMIAFGRAQGTITFVKAEYVESISNEGGRTVILTNGLKNKTGYWCDGVDWPENILS